MKVKLRRILAFLLVLALLNADVCAIAEMVATLTLPSALQIIDVEAFYDNVSIERVIIPAGTKEIRSRAFARSSLSALELPDTLTYIAADAFEGCGEIAVTVPENCYAYDRCVELGLIRLPAELTVTTVSCTVAGNAYVGSVPVWAVRTEGGEGGIEYRFELLHDGKVIASQDYASRNYFSYPLNAPGSYVLNVSCRDEEQNVVSSTAETIRVLAEPLQLVAVRGSAAEAMVGDTISWTAETLYGSAPVQYSFTVLCDGEKVDEQAFSAAATYAFKPEKAGYYAVQVTCMDGDATVLQMQSDVITVYSLEQAVPAAPVLIFEDSASAFAEQESNAPVYDGQSITVSWEPVENAQFYFITLDRNVNGQWVNLLAEEGFAACSTRLNAALFADQTERAVYRFGIGAQGLKTGEIRYSYFAVEKGEVDESLLVEGVTELAWDQAHCYGSVRELNVTSQLAWTAVTDADWLECTVEDNGKLRVAMSAQAQIAERAAVITLSNGVNTALIHVYQGTAQQPPKLLIPVLSTDESKPTQRPVGEFKIEWDDSEFGRTLLNVYEIQSDGTLRTVYSKRTTRNYWYMDASGIGEELQAGKRYIIELKGLYENGSSKTEVDEHALGQRYYIDVTSGGHSILVNGEEAITLTNILHEKVFATASNFFTCETDAAWLEANVASSSSTESSVNIYADLNDTASERVGHVTLRCGTAQAVITVRQESMLPQIVKPAGLSQNESSPTTLYADLNKLNESYELFMYRGDSMTIAKGSNGSYGEEIKVDSSSSFMLQEAELSTENLTAGGKYRLTVTNEDLTTCYYVKFVDNDEEPYDDVAVNGRIVTKFDIGVAAQTMTAQLKAATGWKATSDASWLTVSKASGTKGTHTLTLTVQANTTGKQRTGIITVKSTVSECEVWIVVTQAAQDFMGVYYNGDAGYEPYDAAKHCTMLESAEGKTAAFIVYSAIDYRVQSNADWITLSSGGAKSTSKETGEKFYLYVTKNTTGAPRTGTATVSCGSITQTVQITQAPAMGKLALVSPALSDDSDNPSIIQYADTVVTWKAVTGAVKYKVTSSGYSGIDQIIHADGSKQYSFTVPKSWMEAYSDDSQKLSVTAYDQYGYYERYSYFFQAVTGDAALVNGESEPEWLNAEDVATYEDFVIQASQNWSAKASASWITLSASSGASGETLRVSLSENTGAARSGQVTITVGSASTVLRISQCAYLAKELPELITPVLSAEKEKPTLVAAGGTLSCTWDWEPQAWHYSLSVGRYIGESTRRIVAKSGTLKDGKGQYVFSDLELIPGELYALQLERYTARYGYTVATYYMTVSPENAWVLMDGESALELEYDGGEEHDYLEITASGYWQATTEDDWILLNNKPVHQADLDESGKTAWAYSSYGNVSGEDLCVSVLANASSTPRTGTVTVTSGSASATIAVKQYQNYVIAQLVSPVLSNTSASMTKQKFGSVSLRWNSAEGGTGRYSVTLYESESQRTGYYRIYEKTGITSLSHTIPESEFVEGMYYRVRLDTELAQNDSYGESYYFQMGYRNELAASLTLSDTTATVGKQLGVTVQASGGAGGYKYAYQLLRNGTVVAETTYENMTFYSFAPTAEGTYSIRVYVTDAAGSVITVDSQTFQAENAAASISLSSSIWTAGASAASMDVTVTASTAFTASASDSWIGVSTQGMAAVVSVQENTSSASRSGSVTFTAGNASAVLRIAQEGRSASSGAAITLSSALWEIADASGASVTNLTITATGPWTASNVPEWLSLTAVSGTGSTTIQVCAEQNQSVMRSAQIDFTCGGQTTGWLVVQAGSELAPRVTKVTVTNDNPETGTEVTFAVTSSHADTLIFTVDGVAHEEISVMGDVTSYTRAFSAGGTRQVTFVPVRGGVIGAPSDPVTMNVTTYGKLTAPVLSCDTQAELGESVQVSWNKVEHADAYVILVKRDGIVLVNEPAWKEEAFKLTYEVLSCAGSYMVQVLAVGKGYSQSEAAVIVQVTTPDTKAQLTAPRAGSTYDVGNVVGLQASNPEGRPLALHLYRGGELIASFPEPGTTSAVEPYYEYTLTEAGTYQADMTVYGAAGNVIAAIPKVAFTVSGPTIEAGTKIGTGARAMFIADAASFKVVTNTSVSTVTLTDGSKTYTVTGGGTLNTSNWTRVFTGTMDAPAEGKHVVKVTAKDDYGHTATKPLTYYAVTRVNSTTVYPQAKKVSLRSAPDSQNATAVLQASDKATLLGNCGEYRYVDFGGIRGFVHQNEIGTVRMTAWEGLNVAIPMLISKDLPGCILSDSNINLYWTSSVVLPASAQYRMSLVSGNGAVRQMYQGSSGSCSIPMKSLASGKYTVRIEVVSSDNEVTYLVFDSLHKLDMKSTYPEYFSALDSEEYEWRLGNVIDTYHLFVNLYKFFTTHGYYDERSGEVVKADLEKITKNALFKTYQAYFGDTLTALGEKNLVRAGVAEAIMDGAATLKTPELKLDDFKNFLEFFGVEEKVIAQICAAEEIALAGVINDYNPYTSSEFFEDLTEDHSLDKLEIMKGVSTGVKVYELMASVWSKYVKYSSVDKTEISKIIAHFKATGDEELIGIAEYLDAMNSSGSLLTYLIVGYGGKKVADYVIDKSKDNVEKGVSKLVSRLPGGFAFTIGAAIGKEIGLAINNGVFNVEDIQNKACELQWRIDAADAYYGTYVDAYLAFLRDPVDGYADYVEKTITFSQMISIIYQGWADYVKAVDDAGWSKFVRFWTQDAGLADKAQHHADTLPDMALNNLGTNLEYFYVQFLQPQGVRHVQIPGVWVDMGE